MKRLFGGVEGCRRNLLNLWATKEREFSLVFTFFLLCGCTFLGLFDLCGCTFLDRFGPLFSVEFSLLLAFLLCGCTFSGLNASINLLFSVELGLLLTFFLLCRCTLSAAMRASICANFGKHTSMRGLSRPSG